VPPRLDSPILSGEISPSAFRRADTAVIVTSLL